MVYQNYYSTNGARIFSIQRSLADNVKKEKYNMKCMTIQNITYLKTLVAK